MYSLVVLVGVTPYVSLRHDRDPCPLGKYKYDTWRIFLVKCYIANSMRLRSCIRNINTCVHEAACQIDIKPDRPIRGFGRPATPWAHWSVTLHTTSSCQVHLQGDTYFGGIQNFLVIS
jgi:hypothetical protein